AFGRTRTKIMTAAEFQIQPQPSKTAEGSVELFQNSPNPFIEMTNLWFRLPAAAFVFLRIFDTSGHEVSAKTGNFQHGENHIVLHRADLREPGFYTCRLETPFGTASRKLMMY
ncbi:MAG: T9SS type A sorting domain-containing protein, partial [Saprospiraceae bacterium]